MSTNQANAITSEVQAMNAMLAELQAKIAAMTAPTATSAPVATPTPAPAKKSRAKKTAPALVAATPAPSTAPVAMAAPNGMKIDGTDVYRAMVAFTHKAIAVLSKADGNKSKGIHSVYSGFNAAFGKHFTLAKEQVFACVDAMAERGHIAKRFAKGGVMIYMPGDMPEQKRADADATLALILATK